MTMDKTKERLCQLTSVMLCSLFCFHLAMQALVLLHMVQFRAIWFDVVPFGAPYACYSNLTYL